jgi:hypothetical protein
MKRAARSCTFAIQHYATAFYAGGPQSCGSTRPCVCLANGHSHRSLGHRPRLRVWFRFGQRPYSCSFRRRKCGYGLRPNGAFVTDSWGVAPGYDEGRPSAKGILLHEPNDMLICWQWHNPVFAKREAPYHKSWPTFNKNLGAVTNIEKLPTFRDRDEDRISTSHIERFNLTYRMSMRRFTRLTNGHSKSLRHHTAMQALFIA